MTFISIKSIVSTFTPVIHRFLRPGCAAACTAALATISGLAGTSKADVVADWNAIADAAVVTNAKRPAGAALVDMAYVHAAMYDAVNAIDGGYTVYAVAPAAKPEPGTSKEAAAATAAHRVLLALFPAQETFLAAKYAGYMAAIREGGAKAAGVALGDEIAAKFMAARANDGRNANVPSGPWGSIGDWVPAPGSTTPPLTPWMATMRPFLIEYPAQFRPDGPPTLDSTEWAEAYNETKAYGSLTNSLRTEEQTKIGLFYTDHTGSQYSRIFRNFASGQKHLTVADNARLFAMLYLSMADSLIAGWDAKYHFHRWRPVTAIRAGASDGNEATTADPGWLPLAATPGHPEYPAAHGCLTAAYAEALREFYGTKEVPIALSSTTTNSLRRFDNTDDLIKEIIDARVYGGMHFRFSGRDGANIGKKVTRWMAKHYFRPVN